MLLGTKLNKVPSNEAELNKLLQDIYLKAKENYESDIKSIDVINHNKSICYQVNKELTYFLNN